MRAEEKRALRASGIITFLKRVFSIDPPVPRANAVDNLVAPPVIPTRNIRDMSAQELAVEATKNPAALKKQLDELSSEEGKQFLKKFDELSLEERKQFLKKLNVPTPIPYAEADVLERMARDHQAKEAFKAIPAENSPFPPEISNKIADYVA